MAEPYPYTAFCFSAKFELDGAGDQDIRFQEVSGLSSELSVENVQEGGENRFIHRLPGRAKFPSLVLKRAVITDSALISWFDDAIENLEIAPVDLTVSLLDEKQDAVRVWNFVKAWPTKWSLSNLNAQSNALAIETIELAYQRFWRD